jgi:hypothetical protein
VTVNGNKADGALPPGVQRRRPQGLQPQDAGPREDGERWAIVRESTGA